LLHFNSDNNKVHHNTVFGNGENLDFDAGIIIRTGSDNNIVHQNDVSENFGEGISVRSGSDFNKVFQNNAFDNTFGLVNSVLHGGDLTERTAGPDNKWTKNCFDNQTPAGLSTESNKCPIPNAGA